jgi:hypothetical protein
MRPILAAFNFHGLMACACFALIAPEAQSAAAGEDNFDGAVWKFEMSNKKEPAKKMVGRFRVSNHVLFQKDTPSDPKYSKRVGKNYPNGKRTRVEVRDFRAFTKEGMNQVRLEGTARLSLVKFGEWEGLFTDGSGSNWGFTASRIEE